MKIGILTLPLHTNYGGILQAFALQTVLERMGHKVYVFDKRRKPVVEISLMVKIKRAILKYLMFRKVQEIPILVEFQRVKKRNTNTWCFADHYIHRMELDCVNQIHEGDFEAIVVGSDQIWRKPYILNNFKCIDEAYLRFTQNWNVKRIAYAPSFGVDEWEYTSDETERMKFLLQKFDAISVRELSGVDLCKDHLGFEVQQVLDPTMLLTAEDYMSLLKNTAKSKGSLLCYVLDMTEEKQIQIDTIAKESGLIPFTVNANVEAEWGSDKVSVQPPVEQWLRGFMDAELVVTDSFHACVFSIIFNKRFLVLCNKNRGTTRIDSLLSTFGGEPSLERSKKLKILRDYSLKFLNEALCQK